MSEEKVKVQFGERYVGQAPKAGFQIDTDLTILVTCHYPLLEPGTRTKAVSLDDLKERAEKAHDEAGDILDDIQKTLAKTTDYQTALLTDRDPYPLISLSQNGTVEIEVSFKFTPEQETARSFPLDKLQDLRTAFAALLTKKGFNITTFNEP